jgi:riboflavin biosynthesis pyrimidine reductase
MRTLVGDGSYAWPEGPWLRVNFVSTVDGSAQGPDGRSGTINNEVDRQVFQDLRRSADVILVGAGTARAEGYGPVGIPMAVIGHELPEKLLGAPEVRLVGGALTQVIADLQREFPHVLCEGGPSIFAELVRLGLVDEVCLTQTPQLVAGPGKRILDGTPVDVPLSLISLVEHDGTLLSRWLVSRP